VRLRRGVTHSPLLYLHCEHNSTLAMQLLLVTVMYAYYPFVQTSFLAAYHWTAQQLHSLHQALTFCKQQTAACLELQQSLLCLGGSA